MKWFLFVFVLCVLTAIAVLPSVSATTTTRYTTYNITDFGNGTHVLLAGLPPRLADGAGHFQKDYYFYNNTNSYTIATGFGTYVYSVNTCGMKLFPPTQNPTGTPGINSITFTARKSPVSIGQFNPVIVGGQCINKVINTGSLLQINGTKSDANVTMTVSYTLNAGQPMKESVYLIPKVAGYFWRVTESQSGIPNFIKTGNKTFAEVNSTSTSNTTNAIIPNVPQRITYQEFNKRQIFYDYQTSLNYLERTGIALNSNSGRTTLFNDFKT